MFEIWGRNNSVNVQKVLWCCEELGLEYQRIDAGGAFGRTGDSDYLALNPGGLVPTLVDDGFALWESNAITRYIARRYGEGRLLPDGFQAEALIDQWMDWQTISVWPRFRPTFMGLVRTPEAERNHEAIADGIAGTGQLLHLLDAHLADRDYLLGAHFTLADIPLGATAYRWFGLDIERPTLPNLEAWYERLCQRDAYARTITSIPLT
ncbi:MAG: glutathione S-transferase [Salinisphaera sp.]|jgi:glutathione S-transferase|nr:glutathione S-transferase [Salinisphaera sp.]